MKTRIHHLLFLSLFCLGCLTAEVGFGASGAGKEEGDAGAVRGVIRTDMIYAIKSVSSDCWLHGGEISKDINLHALLVSKDVISEKDKAFQWQFISLENGDPDSKEIYALRSMHSGRWLDGRNPTRETNVLCVPGERNPQENKYLPWKSIHLKDKIFAFKSLSSGKWLDGSAPSDVGALIADGKRTPQTDKYLQWQLIPIAPGYGVDRIGYGKLLPSTVKGTILDRDRFDLALEKGEFSRAWAMGSDSDQGRLWRELSLIKCKKHLKFLARESVFAADPTIVRIANRVIVGFPEALRRDLTEHFKAEEAAAEKILKNLVPDKVAMLVALRQLSDFLSGD